MDPVLLPGRCRSAPVHTLLCSSPCQARQHEPAGGLEAVTRDAAMRRQGCCPSRSARRALAHHGSVHPHHNSCCSSGCCPMEQGRPQHRRLGDPPRPRQPKPRAHRLGPDRRSASSSSSCPDPGTYPHWLFLETSGCRTGEALGLWWSDVDLETRTAIIGHQVVTVDHEIVFKDVPKTKRAHVVRLDSGTVSMVQSWKAAQNAERLLGGPGYANHGLVFSVADGRPFHPERFSRVPTQAGAVQPSQPRLTAPPPRAARAPPYLGDFGAPRGHRYQNRERPTQPLVDPHCERDLHPRDAPMQSDAAERVAKNIYG
jgi:hypothetical protein